MTELILTDNEQALINVLRTADTSEMQMAYSILAATSNETLKQVAGRAEAHVEWLESVRVLLAGDEPNEETMAQAVQLFVNYNLPEMSGDVARDDSAWTRSMERILETARRITTVCNIFYQLGIVMQDMAGIPNDQQPE